MDCECLSASCGYNTKAKRVAQFKALQNEVENVYSKLHHKNIVKCYAMLFFECNVHLVLEYLPGGSIMHTFQMHKGGLPIPTAVRYLQQILEGLAFLHSKDIAHRDLKCENVLLDADDVCKLVDFGCSKQVTELAASADVQHKKATFCGTLRYLAPEVHLRSNASDVDWKKCDVWALGCTMIEMLTTEGPWEDELKDTENKVESQMFKLRQICSSQCRPGLPSCTDDSQEQIHNFLDECLLFSSADRSCCDQLLQHTLFDLLLPPLHSCSY